MPPCAIGNANKKSIRANGCFFVFKETGSALNSRAVSSQVRSAYGCLTAVFGMGTGGTTQLSPPDFLEGLRPQNPTGEKRRTFFEVKPSAY